MAELYIDGNSLTINDVYNVAKGGINVKITEEACIRVAKARELVDRYVSENRVEYGITTGFGKFADVTISKDETAELQYNLIRSHSCGVDEPLPIDVARAVMLLRANALAKGYSGIRLETLNTLVEMLNKDIIPVIPSKGSLGASGDLAPLAHMALVLIGEGEAYYRGKRIPGGEAMNLAGIRPVRLDSKEGLALINGTPVMTAIGALAIHDAINLIKAADIAGALSMEALRGIRDAFDERVHMLRPHVGQIATAKNIRLLVEGSSLVTGQGELRVQDAYSIRCMPQVHGASRDAINYIKGIVEIEMNSVTDNPLIFPDDDIVISGGNFHGQPIALAMDFLGVALSELADISERRIAKLIDSNLNNGLPGFLIREGGLNSGFMIPQYVAASLVSENKVLSHPASVDSIPSSANQEDHVSMGTIAARKVREILDNSINVVAIELMTSAQAIDLRDAGFPGKGTAAAYSLIRSRVPFIEKDELMYRHINDCAELIKNGELIKKVEDEIGPLN
ncbi:MAG: histidine ammonia-lyase [Thermoanaerobacteraceae bacterium]|nr:histidine ammonia-lyase [Thermoanaerobacteraceae bacterium]